METVPSVNAKRTKVLASLLTVIATLAIVDVSTAGATSADSGVITGRVIECGPGPIIVSPSSLVPQPTPVLVRVIHDDRTVAFRELQMSQRMPWSGTFRFSLPAGTYEVTSSYRNVARWVKVRPGSHDVVSFGVFACPMLITPAKPA
jgi:hypothetical protein